MKIEKLVIDTNAFFERIPLWDFGKVFFSIPEAVYEIRDRQTKQHIESLPFELKLQDPSPESVKFINEFTKKTGDYPSLSLVDIKLLALTYEFEKIAKNGDSHLRSRPDPARTEILASRRPPPSHFSELPEGFYCPQEKKTTETTETKDEPTDGLSEDSCSDESKLDCADSLLVDSKESSDITQNSDVITASELEYTVEIEEGEDSDCSKEEEEDDDDDEGWITPQKLRSMKIHENKVDENAEQVEVACMTTDFAMQNTLRHIGLEVVGFNGKLIRNTKTFTLRCYACYKITNKMDRMFCPHCGHKTLKRVSVTVQPDGTQKIWLSTRRPINIRGTKFSLPTPRSGKHAINPILVADQRIYHDKPTKKMIQRMNMNPLNPDYIASSRPFGVTDIYSKSAQLGVSGERKHRGTMYWEQKNPNESKKNASRRKK